MDYLYLRDRQKIEKHTKYKECERSNVTKSKKEKEYEYYLCDYCLKEIKIKTKKYEMSGGICTIPQSLTKKESLKLVLHNKCLKPAIMELEV